MWHWSATMDVPCPLGMLLLPLLSLFLLLLPKPVGGLIPSVCADNATTPDAECCPIPPGSSEPCGGPGRGRCVYIAPSDEKYSPVVAALSQDDRLDWPRRFFKYQCQCEDRFMGFMCHECYWGYYGENCQDYRRAIRRNALSLGSEARREFREGLRLSKTVPSEWVVPINFREFDPITKPVFMSVTVYNFISFTHAYSTRHTLDRTGGPLCKKEHRYDFSHMGSSFPTWHRLFILKWERELQKILGNPFFTFPYWNFVGRGDICEVCNNEFVGSTYLLDPDYPLDPRSPFSDWTNTCQHPSDQESCFICDGGRPGRKLQRRPRSSRHLPKVEDRQWAEGQLSYDSPPYNTRAPRGFRNAMEGFLADYGLVSDRENEHYKMHNAAHEFFQGPISYTSISSDDPLFTLLHSYIDKLLEQWIRRHNPSIAQLPDSGAPAGHNWNASLVPFFPRELSHHYFRNSRNFGYDYDDMVDGYKWFQDRIPDSAVSLAASHVWLSIVTIWIIFMS